MYHRKHAPRHTAPAIGGLPFGGKNGDKLSALAVIGLLAASAVIAYAQREHPTPVPVIFFSTAWLILFVWAAGLAGCSQCRKDGLKCKAGGPRWASAAMLAIALAGVDAGAVASTTVGERPTQTVTVQASAVLGAGVGGAWGILGDLKRLVTEQPAKPAPTTTTRRVR